MGKKLTERVTWVGKVDWKIRRGFKISRLLPFCCYINVPMCYRNGVRYFDEKWAWKLNANPGNPASNWYDTGASFLRDTRDLPHREVEIDDYIVHYGGGSWREDKKMSPSEWLDANSNLYK